jgi:NNP family nitrate/nitrite transporter-like MFS transporter
MSPDRRPFAVLGIPIKAKLGLNETEFGLLVATPVLSGALVRVPLGIWTDRYGGRMVFFTLMLACALAIYLISYATDCWHFLVLGLFVGLAGGSFSVGTPYVARWFGKERRGLAMAATALLFWFGTYSDPAHTSASGESVAAQMRVLKDPRVWRCCQYYSVVFGGYVALALWMTKYYVGEYGFGLKEAALLAACFSLPGGALRALGGWISGKFGAHKVTWSVMWVCRVCSFMLLYGTVCVSLVWMHFSFKPHTKSPVAAPVAPLRKAA